MRTVSATNHKFLPVKVFMQRRSQSSRFLHEYGSRSGADPIESRRKIHQFDPKSNSKCPFHVAILHATRNTGFVAQQNRFAGIAKFRVTKSIAFAEFEPKLYCELVEGRFSWPESIGAARSEL